MGYFDDEDDLAVTAQEQAASGTQWDPNVRAHMMKMLTGGGDSEALTQARTDADGKRSRLGVIEGLSTMFAGSQKTDGGFYNSMRADAGQGVKDAQMADATRQKITQYLIEKDDGLRALSARGEAAKAAQAGAIAAKADQRTWQEGENEKNRTAANGRARIMASGTNSRFDATADRLAAQHEYQVSKDTAAKASSAEEKINTKTRQLGDDLNPLQAMEASYEALEKELGFKLEDYDPATSKAKVKTADGAEAVRKVDLPGVSLPGLGRVNFYDADARTLSGSIANIVNKEIKDKAGATVTTGEMERIKQGFNSGKFNTEAEQIKALTDFKRSLSQAMKDRQSGYDENVVTEYKKRGGTTAVDVPPSASYQSGGGAIAAPSGPAKPMDQMTMQELEAYRDSLRGGK